MSERKEKFTPGPWWVDGSSYPAGMQVIDCQVSRTFSSDVGTVVAPVAYCPFMADLEDYSNDAGEAIYNSALIAAAPDLYEALHKMVAWQTADPGDLDDWNSAMDAARAALSKARGET